MAPKTYPQQVADLKQEKQALTDQVERLQKELEDLQPIRSQLDEANAALVAAKKTSSQGVSDISAQLTDAKQRADSEAAHARRVVDENTRLVHVNGALINRLEVMERTQEFLADKDAQISQLGAELQALSFQQSRREQQITDALRDKEAVIESMSEELRRLRLESRSHPNEIAQVKQDAAQRVDAAEKSVKEYQEAVQWYSAELAKAKAAIKQYHEIVNDLPDTKAQLLSILTPVSAG